MTETDTSSDPFDNGQSFQRMRIHVVCYEDYDAWILGKIARRLCQEVEAQGMDVTLGKTPDPAADINHHVIYYDYADRAPTIETVMITHIDNERERAKVRRQLVDCGVEMGICMSSDTVHRLARLGLPRTRLCFISPGHDGVIAPRKTLVGLTTRVYPDGCKREQLLADLAETIAPADFTFAIMGAGWDAIVKRLRERGFDVWYVDHFDEGLYRSLVPALDYYLYLGQDEGSMGFLDAVAAGIPTIVTPQGFHLDVPDGITHPFETLDELREVFSTIAAEKRRRAARVAPLTWSANARNHLAVWDYLRRQQAGTDIPADLARGLHRLGLVTA